MVFTLTITDSQTKLIFSDLFIMDNELEVDSKFKFLRERKKYEGNQKAYFLEIKSFKKTLIEVSTNSISTVQNLKTRIYNVLIEKLKDDKPYSSPESNLRIDSITINNQT